MNILEHNTIDSKSILRKCGWPSRSANRPSDSLCRNLAKSLVPLVIQKTLLTARSYAGLGKAVLGVWLCLASCYRALDIVTRQKSCGMK